MLLQTWHCRPPVRPASVAGRLRSQLTRMVVRMVPPFLAQCPRTCHPTAPSGQISGSCRLPAPRGLEIGRAHVSTPVTNAHIVCRLLLAKNTEYNVQLYVPTN